MTFGREVSEDDSRQMLDRFVAAGGNFIDTADVYSRGASEEILGRWLAGKRRDDLVIATKVRWEPTIRRPAAQPISASAASTSCRVEASLRRLKTD